MAGCSIGVEQIGVKRIPPALMAGAVWRLVVIIRQRCANVESAANWMSLAQSNAPEDIVL